MEATVTMSLDKFKEIQAKADAFDNKAVVIYSYGENVDHVMSLPRENIIEEVLKSNLEAREKTIKDLKADNKELMDKLKRRFKLF